jgi:hypothetical protein
MNRLPRYIAFFILVVLLQVLIFNHIQFSNLINPYFYVLFVLILPFDTPKSFLLISSFLLGLSIDLLSNTPGMHAAATTLMAFCRPRVLKWISPRDDYESGTLPTLYYYGLNWFLKYTLILVLIHHFTLFYIEMFRWSDFFFTFLRVIASTVFSSFLIIISQYFFMKR